MCMFVWRAMPGQNSIHNEEMGTRRRSWLSRDFLWGTVHGILQLPRTSTMHCEQCCMPFHGTMFGLTIHAKLIFSIILLCLWVRTWARACVCACVRSCMCFQRLLCEIKNDAWRCLLVDEPTNDLIRLIGTSLQWDSEHCSAAVDQAL